MKWAVFSSSRMSSSRHSPTSITKSPASLCWVTMEAVWEEVDTGPSSRLSIPTSLTTFRALGTRSPSPTRAPCPGRGSSGNPPRAAQTAPARCRTLASARRRTSAGARWAAASAATCSVQLAVSWGGPRVTRGCPPPYPAPPRPPPRPRTVTSCWGCWTWSTGRRSSWGPSSWWRRSGVRPRQRDTRRAGRPWGPYTSTSQGPVITLTVSPVITIPKREPAGENCLVTDIRTEIIWWIESQSLRMRRSAPISKFPNWNLRFLEFLVKKNFWRSNCERPSVSKVSLTVKFMTCTRSMWKVARRTKAELFIQFRLSRGADTRPVAASRAETLSSARAGARPSSRRAQSTLRSGSPGRRRGPAPCPGALSCCSPLAARASQWSASDRGQSPQAGPGRAQGSLIAWPGPLMSTSCPLSSTGCCPMTNCRPNPAQLRISMTRDWVSSPPTLRSVCSLAASTLTALTTSSRPPSPSSSSPRSGGRRRWISTLSCPAQWRPCRPSWPRVSAWSRTGRRSAKCWAQPVSSSFRDSCSPLWWRTR